MKDILNIYKPIGKTPYEMVKKVKQVYPVLAEKKIGYAGRLDPMAHGVLLLLVGDTNKQKIKFESMEKEYVFQALFGMKTDSFDLLGKVTTDYEKYNVEDLKRRIKREIKNYKGTFLQTYPPYSAIRLNGQPLYYWELRGVLPKVSIPQKEITIHSFTMISEDILKADYLQEIIQNRIHKVAGNFRQAEILKTWKKFFKEHNSGFLSAKFIIHCSSGTYVRSIVNDLGEKLKVGATTLSILRTKVGKHTLKKSIIM